MRSVISIFIALGIVLVVTLVVMLLSHSKTLDYDCDDFRYWGEAQERFEENKRDIYHLDMNNNGIPCEKLPSK